MRRALIAHLIDTSFCLNSITTNLWPQRSALAINNASLMRTFHTVKFHINNEDPRDWSYLATTLRLVINKGVSLMTEWAVVNPRYLRRTVSAHLLKGFITRPGRVPRRLRQRVAISDLFIPPETHDRFSDIFGYLFFFWSADSHYEAFC